MYKNILFDFDGTLVDTNEIIIKCLNMVSGKFLGKELSKHELNSILGRHLEEQMKCLSNEYSEEMVSHYRDSYKSLQDSLTKEYPGVSRMLCDIKYQGCKNAIVSAKGRGGIEHGLRMFNLYDYFDVIISAYDIKNNKPHPEPALKALAALNASKETSLIVGDSPYDIQCGINAGIKTVLVGWTIFPEEAFVSCKPDFVINKPDELTNIVKSFSE